MTMLPSRGQELLAHLTAALQELTRKEDSAVFGEMSPGDTDFNVGWERSKRYFLLHATENAVARLVWELKRAAERKVQP